MVIARFLFAFKGKGTQKYKWILSKSILKTAHFNANCMKIGFLVFEILQFYGGRHFEMPFKLKIMKLNLFLKSMHKHIQFTNVIFVYYVNNHFFGNSLNNEYCTFISHYWKNINIHCELVTSQPH